MISKFLFDSDSFLPTPLMMPKKDHMNPASHCSRDPGCSLDCTNTRHLPICFDNSSPFSERRNNFFFFGGGGSVGFTRQSAQIFDLMGSGSESLWVFLMIYHFLLDF